MHNIIVVLHYMFNGTYMNSELLYNTVRRSTLGRSHLVIVHDTVYILGCQRAGLGQFLVVTDLTTTYCT